MDSCAAVAALVLILLAGVGIVVARRERGAACPRCGAKLPHDARYCPACQAPIGREPTAVSFELVAVRGPLAQRRFPIPAQGLTIGRRPDNDIVLPPNEMTVSRHHAQISVEAGQYLLFDRDSANGTWVNEQRIFRHTLVPGDRIQIWQSEFAFVRAGTPAPAPAPLPRPEPAVEVTSEYFDGYHLVHRIGKGGMAEVYKAHDPNGQTVAIKILRVTEPYLVAKFVKEGNEIGPLLRGHPNIVYVYGFRQSQDGHLYIVMEYVDAPSLRKVMNRQWPEAEVIRIIGQACNGLAHAHRQNVVHRDVKPENILVGNNGVVKIADFGIAKLTSAATATSDQIIGTPEYLSPEQASGDPPLPASDVYSLGIVLYELLAGSVPFRRPAGEDPRQAMMQVLHQQRFERPEPMRHRNPHAQLSPRLEQVTMRALDKEARRRFRTAGEMGEALGYRHSVDIAPMSARPGRAWLTILKGPRQGQRIPLAGRSVALGRANLGSTQSSISPLHANILPRGDGYWLQAVSRNSTWVDQQRVYGEVPLRTGAIIAIGDTVLRLDTQQ